MITVTLWLHNATHKAMNLLMFSVLSVAREKWAYLKTVLSLCRKLPFLACFTIFGLTFKVFLLTLFYAILVQQCKRNPYING